MRITTSDDLIPSMDVLVRRYRELREYVELTDADVAAAVATWPLVQPHLAELVDDFYDEILKHPEAAAVIRGGQAQVDRLKSTLQQWLRELFEGTYDEQFVRNRWLVGWRHVQLGLAQVWTATAMSRMRDRLLKKLMAHWSACVVEFGRTASAISRLMDIDLALIQDAYHTASLAAYLQGEKEYNETIISSTESIVLVLDAAGRIVRGNSFLARLVCGSDLLDARIQRLEDLVPVEDLPQLQKLLSNASEPKSRGPVTSRLTDCNACRRTIRWFARTILLPSVPNYQGTENFRLLVGQDVTDLTEAQRIMVQQERLAAIGQTMAGLAHESRNAFQRSQAALEMLALDIEDRPNAVELVGRIQRANDHLLHLYEEVLQFAKPVRLDLVACDILEICTATCQHICQATQCSSDRFVVQLGSHDPSIMADRFATEQILRNLIENALVVSPPEKQITIAISSAWQGERPCVRIEVKDEGPGIPPDHIDRVFEPFFSTRSKGTGLGLPIARRLAEAHGGSLELYSSSQGTTAVLTLPRVATKDQAADPENQPDHRRRGAV